MLAVYLFNLTGYNFLFRYYIHQSDKEISQRADINDFSEASLVEVKVKLNLPYLTDWSDYQRYDGEMEVNGIHYNYVKRKVSLDTLYLLCLPNELKTKLYHTSTDYAMKANDLPAEKQNKNSEAKKNFAQEGGKVQLMQFSFVSFDNRKNSQHYNLRSILPDTYISSPGQPPEPVC